MVLEVRKHYRGDIMKISPMVIGAPKPVDPNIPVIMGNGNGGIVPPWLIPVPKPVDPETKPMPIVTKA